jgi:hypothetical protein
MEHTKLWLLIIKTCIRFISWLVFVMCLSSFVSPFLHGWCPVNTASSWDHTACLAKGNTLKNVQTIDILTCRVTAAEIWHISISLLQSHSSREHHSVLAGSLALQAFAEGLIASGHPIVTAGKVQRDTKPTADTWHHARHLLWTQIRFPEWSPYLIDFLKSEVSLVRKLRMGLSEWTPLKTEEIF